MHSLYRFGVWLCIWHLYIARDPGDGGDNERSPGYDRYTRQCRSNMRGLATNIRNEMRHCVSNAHEYSSDDIGMQGLIVLLENLEWEVYNVLSQVDYLSNECNWDLLSEVADSDGKCLWLSLIKLLALYPCFFSSTLSCIIVAHIWYIVLHRRLVSGVFV